MAIYKGTNPIQAELFDRCSMHVGVIVDDKTPIGTGIFIKRDAQYLFITAKHVLNLDIFTKKLKISFNFTESRGEISWMLEIIDCYVELENDIAILHLNQELPITPYELNDRSFVDLETENMLTWGCPTQLTAFDGKFVRFRLINLWAKVISYNRYIKLNIDYKITSQQSLTSLGGVSGGPIFNTNGKFVGLNKQQLLGKKTIAALEATRIEKTNISKYIHVNTRRELLYELPLLLSAKFLLKIDKVDYSFVFESLLAFDDDGNSNYKNIWISHAYLAVENKNNYDVKMRCLDVSSMVLFEVGTDIRFNERVFYCFEDSGKDKLKSLAQEFVYSMLFGSTDKGYNIAFDEFDVGTLQSKHFEGILNSFTLYPIYRPV